MRSVSTRHYYASGSTRRYSTTGQLYGSDSTIHSGTPDKIKPHAVSVPGSVVPYSTEYCEYDDTIRHDSTPYLIAAYAYLIKNTRI
eukprot:130996-Rhodomonas_salina.9